MRNVGGVKDEECHRIEDSLQLWEASRGEVVQRLGHLAGQHHLMVTVLTGRSPGGGKAPLKQSLGGQAPWKIQLWEMLQLSSGKENN